MGANDHDRDEPEVILKRLADEIMESDEFQQKLRELGPDKIRENIEKGLAKLDQRMVALARERVTITQRSAAQSVRDDES